MGKFDTHGGYFAPKDYFRVNTGGSHEENPNGGVQVGVDPQGVPNMLEEGEPVYKDYVYSDNIRADAQFLEENNLPLKYSGKLYSEIADAFVEEAENRPNDFISNNGLNAMLLRLADAQEAQKEAEKAAKQQEELEEELTNMSPEELEELEMMLAQEEQQEQMTPEEQMPPEMMGPAEQVPQEAAPQQMPMGMPMMAQGGFLRRFDFGGSTDEPVKTPEQIMLEAQQARQMRQQMMEEQAAAEKAESSRRAQEGMIRRYQRQLERNQKALDRLTRNAEKVYPADVASYKTLLKKQQDLVSYSQKRLDDARASYDKTYSVGGVPADTLLQVPYGIGSPADSLDIEFNDEPQGSVAGEKPVWKGDINNYVLEWRRGGQMNRFDGGGWADFLKLVTGYSPSSNAGGIPGTYSIDRNFGYLNGNKDIYALEGSDPYTSFTEYVIAHSDDPNVKAYLELLDKNTGGTADKLFLDGKLREGWDALYRKRRNDHVAGIYHLNPDADFWSASAAQPQPQSQVQVQPGLPASLPGMYRGAMYDWMSSNPDGLHYRSRRQEEPTLFPTGLVPYGAEVSGAVPAPAPEVGAPGVPAPASRPNGYVPLPTAGRYAKALGATAMGLYDLAQQPYQYQFPDIYPQQPWGTVNYQPLVYNPMDWALPYHAMAGQTNASLRALRGTGPSQGANVIGLDNVATQNYGAGMGQAWQQNGAHRNEVIAGNNQTEGQRAAFDYGVSKDRATMYNDAAWKNFMKEFYRQKMDQEEETAKYAALSNQINAGLDALAGIGTENFRMNQANTNTALMGYQVVPDGRGGYKLVSAGKCGGTLLKKYKK